MNASIWLVRHGETDHNVNRIFQGHLDTPLNERGFRQAAVVGKHLRDIEFDSMFASDLSRAAETATAIAKYQSVELSLVPELREMNYGKLQNVPIADFRTVLESHGQSEQWGEGVFAVDEHTAPPGGENLRDLRIRLQRFTQLLEERCNVEEEKSILIVAHGGTLKTLVSMLLELPANARNVFNFDNCSVTKIETSPQGPRLAIYNAVYWVDELVS